MHAEAMLPGAELLIGLAQRQVEPTHAVDDQVVRLAQFARNDVHGTHVTAMRVEQHQLTDAGARNPGADVLPQANQRLGRQRKGAGKARVLRAQADGLGGQEQRRHLVGQQGQRRGHDAVDEAGVHAERQMRPVLLRGAERQDSHGARRVERGEVARRQVGPEAVRRGVGVLHPAILPSALDESLPRQYSPVR
jgi:hypothetical protein